MRLKTAPMKFEATAYFVLGLAWFNTPTKVFLGIDAFRDLFLTPKI